MLSTRDTPISKLNPHHQTLEADEEHYLLHLQTQLQSLYLTITTDFHPHNNPLHQQLQHHTELIQSLVLRNQALQSENVALKLAVSQANRCSKRYQLKVQFLTTKLNHQHKQVCEKEAVIKYLEGRHQDRMRKNPSSLSIQQSYSHFKDCKPQKLSFGRVKQEGTLTFQQFKGYSTNNPNQNQNTRCKQRHKTESNYNKTQWLVTEPLKENRPANNFSSRLQLDRTRLGGCKEWSNNEKTLSKVGQHVLKQSLWKSKPSKGSRQYLNKSINFSTSLIQ